MTSQERADLERKIDEMDAANCALCGKPFALEGALKTRTVYQNEWVHLICFHLMRAQEMKTLSAEEMAARLPEFLAVGSVVLLPCTVKSGPNPEGEWSLVPLPVPVKVRVQQPGVKK